MMQVWKELPAWRARRAELEGRSIGLVPTLGALHRGHASLVDRCRAENDVVVVTIFVNPSQFNDERDLERYPRTLARDLELLESLGAGEVIAPAAADVYLQGYRYCVIPPADALVLEGAHRPGHFEGVLTVVLKLLNLVRADRAYFGEKDFQQVRVVTEMTQEFFQPTQIVPCATVREQSGLAMSSRNALLSPEGREKAAGLWRALTNAVDACEARRMLEADGFVVDYVEERWGRRLAAAYLESVRLIDNVPVAEAR